VRAAAGGGPGRAWAGEESSLEVELPQSAEPAQTASQGPRAVVADLVPTAGREARTQARRGIITMMAALSASQYDLLVQLALALSSCTEQPPTCPHLSARRQGRELTRAKGT
jgi:hypothetical protein